MNPSPQTISHNFVSKGRMNRKRKNDGFDMNPRPKKIQKIDKNFSLGRTGREYPPLQLSGLLGMSRSSNYSFTKPQEEDDDETRLTLIEKNGKVYYKQCTACGDKTPPCWRKGPLGTGTLCNACGLRYKNKRLNLNKKGHNEDSNEGYDHLVLYDKKDGFVSRKKKRMPDGSGSMLSSSVTSSSSSSANGRKFKKKRKRTTSSPSMGGSHDAHLLLRGASSYHPFGNVGMFRNFSSIPPRGVAYPPTTTTATTNPTTTPNLLFRNNFYGTNIGGLYFPTTTPPSSSLLYNHHQHPPSTGLTTTTSSSSPADRTRSNSGYLNPHFHHQHQHHQFQSPQQKTSMTTPSSSTMRGNGINGISQNGIRPPPYTTKTTTNNSTILSSSSSSSPSDLNINKLPSIMNIKQETKHLPLSSSTSIHPSSSSSSNTSSIQPLGKEEKKKENNVILAPLRFSSSIAIQTDLSFWKTETKGIQSMTTSTSSSTTSSTSTMSSTENGDKKIE